MFSDNQLTGDASIALQQVMNTAKNGALIYVQCKSEPFEYDKVFAVSRKGDSIVWCYAIDFEEGMHPPISEVYRRFPAERIVQCEHPTIMYIDKKEMDRLAFHSFGNRPKSCEISVADVLTNGTEKPMRCFLEILVSVNKIYVAFHEKSARNEQGSEMSRGRASAAKQNGIANPSPRDEEQANAHLQEDNKRNQAAKGQTDPTQEALKPSVHAAQPSVHTAQPSVSLHNTVSSEKSKPDQDIRRPSLITETPAQTKPSFVENIGAAKTKNLQTREKSPAPLPLTPEIKKRNLYTVCNITYKTQPIILSGNKEVVTVDKETGAITRTPFADIFSNKMVGISHEIEIVKALQQAPIISTPVDRVAVADVRHMIRLMEGAKNKVFTGAVFASEKVRGVSVLHIALPFHDDNITLRESAIRLHSESTEKYEALRTKLRAYTADTLLVTASKGAFILIREDSGSIRTVDVKQLYQENEDLINVWEIMSMFPADSIVPAGMLGIERPEDIANVAQLNDKVPGSFIAAPVSKRVSFVYDRSCQVLIRCQSEN